MLSLWSAVILRLAEQGNRYTLEQQLDESRAETTLARAEKEQAQQQVLELEGKLAIVIAAATTNASNEVKKETLLAENDVDLTPPEQGQRRKADERALGAEENCAHEVEAEVETGA